MVCCIASRRHARSQRRALKLLLLGWKKRSDVLVRFLEPVPRFAVGSRPGRDNRRMKEEPRILGSFREGLFHLVLGFLEFFLSEPERRCQ